MASNAPDLSHRAGRASHAAPNSRSGSSAPTQERGYTLPGRIQRARPSGREVQAYLNEVIYHHTRHPPAHVLCVFCARVAKDPVTCESCGDLFCVWCWNARSPFPPKCKCADEPLLAPVTMQPASRAIKDAIAVLEILCNRCHHWRGTRGNFFSHLVNTCRADLRFIIMPETLAGPPPISRGGDMEFRTQALFTGLSDTRWGFTPPIMSHPADRQPPLEGPPPAPTFYAGAQARAEREMNATLEQPVTSPPQQTAAASPASRAPVASATISNTTNLAHINRRIRAIREELGVLNIQLGELREAAEDGSQVPNSGIAE